MPGHHGGLGTQHQNMPHDMPHRRTVTPASTSCRSWPSRPQGGSR